MTLAPLTTAPMELNVQAIIAALILAGILWILRSVSEQGRILARIEANYAELNRRVDSLHLWRNEQQAKELKTAIDDLVEERRKSVRREEDRAP